MFFKTLMLITLIIFSLSACSTSPYTQEQQGAAGGAGVGALVGLLFCQNIDNKKLKVFCIATFAGLGAMVGGLFVIRWMNRINKRLWRPCKLCLIMKNIIGQIQEPVPNLLYNRFQLMKRMRRFVVNMRFG